MASQNVAFIGVGNIGRGMCKNLALKGPQTSLVLYNRTESKATAFANTLPPNKAIVASSIPSAVQQADIIFICVGDDPALHKIISTILSDTETNPDLSSKIIVDCSTVHPDTSRRARDDLAARGASFVACPVFGVPAVAEAGQLIVVPAGASEAVERLRPFLDGVVSRQTINVNSSDPGNATALKLMGNTFILNTVETLAEGMAAAEKTGVGAAAYQEWVHAMYPGPIAKYADRMAHGDYHRLEEPLFAVDLARKDIGHARNLAGATGMRLPTAELTDKYLQDVKAERGEKGDLAAIYGAIRKEAGLPFEN